jgi:hypothetical protein
MNDTSPQTNPYSTPAVTPQVVHRETTVLEQYSLVRRGFQLIYYSVAAIAGIVVLMVIVGLLSGAMSPRTVVPSSVTVGALALMGFSFFAAGLVMLVGFLMCAACPNPNEKTKALVSIVSFFLALILGIASGVLEDFQPVPAMICEWSSSLLNVVSTVAFCLFAKQIGTNVSSMELQKCSDSALRWYGALIVGGMLFVLVAALIAASGFQMADSSFMIVLPLGGILLVLALGTFFKFLSMIRSGIIELKPKQ